RYVYFTSPVPPRRGPGSGALGVGDDGLEGDVVDPELADVGADDPEVQGQRGRVGLGAEGPLDVDPAADDGEALLLAAVGQDLPGRRGVLVLRDPGAALALGPGGDQVPVAQAHPGRVAHRLLGEAVVLVARDVGLEVEAVGRRDELAGVAAIGRDAR